MIGATQKSLSCDYAHPPTNNAGPVLRAGLTDKFVTGMPTRWIKVSPRPIEMPAKPLWRKISPWLEPRMISLKEKMRRTTSATKRQEANEPYPGGSANHSHLKQIHQSC